MSYSLGTVYQLDRSPLVSRNEVRIIELLPSPMNSFMPERVETLNSACLKLNSSPTVFIARSKPNCAQVAYGLTNPGLVESQRLHEFLKTIPIYSEVLAFSNKDHKSSESTNMYAKILDDNYKNKPTTPIENYRKRMALEVDTGIREINYVGSPSLSTARTQSLNFHSESSIIGESDVRISNTPISADFRRLQQETRSPLVDRQLSGDYYSATDELKSYKPIIVSKGSNVVIPPGYIQVSKDADCLRKTKEVVNCKHTNRKHYAKGLCSTCYHKNGRTKRAWKCKHTDKLHYAKGCCQECYLTFHSKRGKNKLRRMLEDESVTLSEMLPGNDLEHSIMSNQF